MTLYVFQWPEWNDLWALVASPETDRLPRRHGKDHWRLFRAVEDADLSAGPVPLSQIQEQIAQYGYCLLQVPIQWPEPDAASH
jgi:hypothetical protein